MASIKLPFAVRVDDYHELGYLQGLLPLADKGVKVRVEEAGFDGHYLGIVYAVKDAKYKKLYDELKASVDQFEHETWGR